MEQTLLYILLTYWGMINLLTFFIFGFDKWKAKRMKWRISETILLTLAAMGGSIGAWLGMKIWKHKTLHKKFKYGIPFIILLQISLCIYVFYQMASSN